MQSEEKDFYPNPQSGSFADVWVHKSNNFVAKVLYERDLGFETYLEALKVSPGNPYFPKIYSINSHEDGVKTVIMERLYDLRYYDNKKTWELAEKISSNFFKTETWKEFDKDLQDALESLYLSLAIAEDKKLPVFFDLVGNYTSNLLVRKNGHLVITDPFCDGEILGRMKEFKAEKRNHWEENNKSRVQKLIKLLKSVEVKDE